MLNKAAILISAHSEWRAVLAFYQPEKLSPTPYQESFELEIAGWNCRFVFEGVGKIAAAAATQYEIDTWKPDLIVNLGTCGGIAGQIAQGTILLVNETLVYDIYERMGDPDEPIRRYTTHMELGFLNEPYPIDVARGRLLSADQDLDPAQIPYLIEKYQAVAVDWESSSIAWVAAHNHTPCLILRGVTDLVEPQGGESYGLLELYHSRTREVMPVLLESLPGWLQQVHL